MVSMFGVESGPRASLARLGIACVPEEVLRGPFPFDDASLKSTKVVEVLVPDPQRLLGDKLKQVALLKQIST